MHDIIKIGGRTYKEVSPKRRRNRSMSNRRMNNNSYGYKLRELQSRRKYESEKARFKQEQNIRRSLASARRKEKLARYKEKSKSIIGKFRRKKEYMPPKEVDRAYTQ